MKKVDLYIAVAIEYKDNTKEPDKTLMITRVTEKDASRDIYKEIVNRDFDCDDVIVYHVYEEQYI